MLALTELSNNKDSQTKGIPAALSADLPLEPQNQFIPLLFAETIDPIRSYLWFSAMGKEIAQWDKRCVVTPVPCPKGVNTIKTK